MFLSCVIVGVQELLKFCCHKMAEFRFINTKHSLFTWGTWRPKNDRELVKVTLLSWCWCRNKYSDFLSPLQAMAYCNILAMGWNLRQSTMADFLCVFEQRESRCSFPLACLFRKPSLFSSKIPIRRAGGKRGEWPWSSCCLLVVLEPPWTVSSQDWFIQGWGHSLGTGAEGNATQRFLA